MKASWKSAGRRRQNSCSVATVSRGVAGRFGNRWKTTRTVVASRDTGRGRSFGQATDLLATPAGFEPATLSLEGCQITLIDKHNFSKWTLNRRLSINRLAAISQMRRVPITRGYISREERQLAAAEGKRKPPLRLAGEQRRPKPAYIDGRGQEKTTYPPPRATCELRGNLVRSAAPLQNACYATISGVSTDLPWH
jgi:hypothetical protein